MPDILLPFVICGGFITNIVGVCIILKHLAEQTTLHKQIHIIKGTEFFFQLTFFFWIVKLTVSVVEIFFPHTNHHWWSGFVITFSVGHCPARSQDSPSKSARLHRTLISLLESFDYDQPEEENQPIDGIQDQSFFSCKSIVLLIIQLSTVWMND